MIAITISLGSHQNIGLHTGARANVVLLTYLLTCQDLAVAVVRTEIFKMASGSHFE